MGKRGLKNSSVWEIDGYLRIAGSFGVVHQTMVSSRPPRRLSLIDLPPSSLGDEGEACGGYPHFTTPMASWWLLRYRIHIMIGYQPLGRTATSFVITSIQKVRWSKPGFSVTEGSCTLADRENRHEHLLSWAKHDKYAKPQDREADARTQAV